MKLRRTRAGWLGVALCLPVGILLLLAWSAATPGHLGTLIFGSVSTATGVGCLWWMLRPLRFVIRPDGLDIRSGGINRVIPWQAIETVTLVQPRPTASDRTPSAFLQLIPVPGAEERAQQSPSAQHGIQILSLSDVRETPDEVAQSLTTFGGSRFIDSRTAMQEGFAAQDFTIVLRGYAIDVVSKLVEQANQALNSGSLIQRMGFLGNIQRQTIPVQLRGYDREQVDAYLHRVTAELSNFKDA